MSRNKVLAALAAVVLIVAGAALAVGLARSGGEDPATAGESPRSASSDAAATTTLPEGQSPADEAETDADDPPALTAADATGGQIDAASAEPEPIGFTAVAAGAHHSCALRTDGTIACWGYDYYGQAQPPGAAP